MAVVSGVAGVPGAAGTLAEERGDPGVGDTGRTGAVGPGTRPVEMVNSAIGLGRAVSGGPRAGGAATGESRPFCGGRGRMAALAGLFARSGDDRSGWPAAERAGVQSVPDPGVRIAGLGDVGPVVERTLGASGVVRDRVLGRAGRGACAGARGDIRGLGRAGNARGSEHVEGPRRTGLDQPAPPHGRRVGAGGHRHGDRTGRARLQFLRPPARGRRLRRRRS